MTALYGTTDVARDADLQTIAKILSSQRSRTVDVVAEAKAFSSKYGQLFVTGAPTIMDDDGVTDPNGFYQLTAGAEGDLSGRLNIPAKYLRDLRAVTGDDGDHEGLSLYDDNVNFWLHRNPTAKHMLRLLMNEDAAGNGPAGVVRAIVSDSYKRVDNLDVLLAILAGIKSAGVKPGPGDIRADLTENRMNLKIVSREVKALAPKLLDGYRSPFSKGAERYNGGWTIDSARAAAAREGHGYEPGKEPVVFAGFVGGNSETGDGSFSITPMIEIEICGNGLRLKADAFRSIHLGGKLESGVVKWSDDTHRKNLALVTAKARDAVSSFLNEDYLVRKVHELEVAAGTPVTDAAETVKVVAKQFAFKDEVAKDILDHFILGGQLTAGGIAGAVSSVAQTVSDGDLAALLEELAVPAMQFAAALPRS